MVGCRANCRRFDSLWWRLGNANDTQYAKDVKQILEINVMKSWLLVLASFSVGNCNGIDDKPLSPWERTEEIKIPNKIFDKDIFIAPNKMIEAIHGPYHGCLQWFSNETGAWRQVDPQRWDTASADEYTSDAEPDRTWWMCDIEPKLLSYDQDDDGDIDLKDYSLFVNQWSKNHE